MKIREFVEDHINIIWIMALILGVYATLKIAYPEGTWRYRVTVAIETPEGIKTGSAVREIYVNDTWLKLPNSHDELRTRGEAVVIDLGEKGYLFAIRHSSSYYEFLEAFPSKYGMTTPKGVRYYRSLESGLKNSLKLDENLRTTFVRFQDIEDPASIEEIPFDNFESVFGNGYILKEITIETTNKRVTKEISQILPWLPDYYNQRFNGERFGNLRAKNRIANKYASGNFSTEVK